MITDLKYISNPMLWDTLVCPLKKRRDGGFDCAYMLDATPTIFHGNMFGMKPTDRREDFLQLADILDAGWEVD